MAATRRLWYQGFETGNLGEADLVGEDTVVLRCW